MTDHAIHICSFHAAPNVTRRTTYKEFRAGVLAAGRFSAFEAMATKRAASLYTRLCRDPSVETVNLGFPWTGVRARAGEVAP